MFIVKYDASGNVLWAMGSGNTGDDFANNPTTDAAGNVYVSGSYNYSSMNFGACTLTTEGGYDIFIVKIKDNCFAYYTASYDSILNTFNITIDSATASLATSYHWDFGDGTTSTLANPSHTYTADSLYDVCMKIYTASGDSCSYSHTIGIDTLGNIVRSSGFNLNVNSTNTTNIIQNNLSETVIKFSPNPFNSQTTILADHYLKNVTLTLYNSLGQQVKQLTNISGTTIELKRDNLVSGLYFWKITQGNEIISADRLLITD